MINKSIFVWSPFTGKIGTVKNVINSLYSINKYSNYSTHLINAFGEWDDYKEDIKVKNVDIHNFQYLRFIKNWKIRGFIKSRFSYILIFLFSFIPLFNLIKKQKPDYLVVHLISSLPLLIFKIFNFDTKLILHVAGHPKLNLIRKKIWKLSSKKIFKVICPSEELKNVFLEHNIFDHNQIKVIQDPHLVMKDINVLKREELNDHFFNDSKILIAIGRMTKQKNYSFLIKNFKELASKYTDIKLVIIGDGEDKHNLEILIKQLDLIKKIKLINHKTNIYKYLKMSKFYVSTSLWEGSSLAMVDAAFMGIPILCSDCPSGRKEFIGKNKRGFIYKKNDSQDFLNLFDQMYSLNKEDTKNLTLESKKYVKKFTLFKSYLRFKEILN